MILASAAIYGFNTVVGLIGNLFVLLVVAMYRDFHNMRYFLLASLALSDFLMAIMVCHRAVSNAAEEWVFGSAWCHGAAYVVRVLYLNTVLHLFAVSYERYNAIVRRPLTYSSSITVKRLLQHAIFLWVLPAVISSGPFFGWGDFVYNPEIFTCEQKWDGQTAIPLLIVSFLVPLGAMVYLNYKVLKVVLRLQRGVKVISNAMSGHGNKIMPVCTDQRQQHSQDEQLDDDDRPNPQEQQEQAAIKNGKQPPQMQKMSRCYIVRYHCSEVQGTVNTAYQPECTDVIGTMYQVEVECGDRRMAHAAPPRSFSLKTKPTYRPSDKTLEDGANNNTKKTRKKSKKRQYSLDEANAWAKMDNRTNIAEGNQPSLPNWDETLEDGKGLPKGSLCGVQNPKGRGYSYQQPDFDQINTANANVMEGTSGFRSQSRRQSRRISAKSSPATKTRTAGKQAHTGAQACQEDSGKETGFRSSISQRSSRYNNADDLRKVDVIESVPQVDNLQPDKNHAQEQEKPSGRTQMRLSKLLLEGKAARDVMVIIFAFLLCYLPMWIMAMYRSAGGTLSTSTILPTHWVYSLSMICNPLIYSVRKREFRKAIRKLLKL